MAKVDSTKLLPEQEIKTIKSIVGSFLYYGRAVDYIMLPVLNNILYSQLKLTEFTKEEYQQIIDYAATYMIVYIRYYASDIVLQVNSNAAYLVILQAKS